MSVYIKNDKTTWKVSLESVKYSSLLKSATESTNSNYGSEANPIIITASADVTQYVVSYINYYSDKTELPAPEAPLKNIHISVTLDGEYHLFKDIYLDSDTALQKLMKINKFADASLYFGVKTLHDKLCAIMAFVLKDLTESEIRQLL